MSAKAPSFDREALIADLENAGFVPDSYDLTAVDRLRQIIATRMTQTARDVPHFPVTMDIMLDALMAARTQHNAAHDAVRISINDLVIKAAAVALMAVPELNRSYRPEAIVAHRTADIAVVVAIPDGLMTPIIRNAQDKPVTEIAEEVRHLSARAQTRQLRPGEYTGGTFSISNLGMYGVTSFGSIINQPHGAILSVGAARQIVIPEKGEFRAGQAMTCTLTCDHRVVDGVTGARWMQAFKAAIEEPQHLF